jgi:hypothetical protein
MRYLDTGSRDPADALATWLQAVLTPQVSEVRWQSGFFNEQPLGLFASTFQRLEAARGLVHVLIGSNPPGTQRGAVAALVQVLGLPRPNARLGVVQYRHGFYHPKTIHLRRSDGTQCAYVGSANITGPGVLLHVEAGITLDTNDGDSVDVLNAIAAAVDAWFDQNRAGLRLVNNPADVQQLLDEGVLIEPPPPDPSAPPAIAEAEAEEEEAAAPAAGGGGPPRPRPPALAPLATVPSIAVPAAPPVAVPAQPTPAGASSPAPASALPAAAAATMFLMEMSAYDRSQGRTSGTPEILIPVAAVGFFPPTAFRGRQYEDVYFDVQVNTPTGASVGNYRFWHYPAKGEYRLRPDTQGLTLSQIQAGGAILIVNRLPAGSNPAFGVSVVNPGDPQHAATLARCNQLAQGKRWGMF